MCRPVAHHQHLHGGWGIARNREEWSRRCILFGSRVATPQQDFSVLHGNGFVNGSRTCGAAIDLKLLWSQVCSASESRRKRYGGPAVGELEIDFDSQSIALAADLVGLLADGLLKFVEGELALFQQWSLIRSRLSSEVRHWRGQESDRWQR